MRRLCGAQQKGCRLQEAKVRLQLGPCLDFSRFGARGWGRSLPFQPALSRAARLLARSWSYGTRFALEFWHAIARRGTAAVAVLAGLALLSERVKLPVHMARFSDCQNNPCFFLPGALAIGYTPAGTRQAGALTISGQGLVYQRNHDCAPGAAVTTYCCVQAKDILHLKRRDCGIALRLFS